MHLYSCDETSSSLYLATGSALWLLSNDLGRRTEDLYGRSNCDSGKCGTIVMIATRVDIAAAQLLHPQELSHNQSNLQGRTQRKEEFV